LHSPGGDYKKDEIGKTNKEDGSVTIKLYDMNPNVNADLLKNKFKSIESITRIWKPDGSTFA